MVCRDCYTLDRALEDFRNNLSPEQKVELESISNGTPKPEDVSELVAKINLRNSERKSRMCADKLRTILDSIQQYCTVVDTFIQSYPTVAGLVWGTAKIFILVFKLVSHSEGNR
jgi:nitrate/nitrite-specific signal transduction histidine kinase